MFKDRRHAFKMYGDVKCLIGTVFVVMTSVDLIGDNVFISTQNGSLTATFPNSCHLSLICVYNIVTFKWLSAICLALATSKATVSKTVSPQSGCCIRLTRTTICSLPRTLHTSAGILIKGCKTTSETGTVVHPAVTQSVH